MKRMFSFLMALAMVLSILPMPALAAEGCGNHPAHDESCGYVAAVEGQPCTHQHSDACRVETVNCTHVHTAECYPDGDMEGEPTLCEHVCSEESGCVTVSCNHVHDGECGYVEAVEGKPCNHSCELCDPPEELEDAPVCICDARCNEMVNTDCPVCAVDASKCAVPEASNDLPPVPQVVQDVQAMIDALPTLEEVKAMETPMSVYDQAYAAYEAYCELTEEKMAQVDASLAEALLNYLNALSMTTLEVVSADYVDASGNTHTQENCTVVTSSTSKLESGWYVVNTDVSLRARTDLVQGDVNLILADNCTLSVTGSMSMSAGSHLNIYGESYAGGELKATGDGSYWTAGIRTTDATLTINSGKVTATGGACAAGIGGNRDQDGGTINIRGGYVTATAPGSNGDPAGIGGGGYGDAGTINISGGVVNAKGSNVGIGLGYGKNGGSITITGGTITANGIGVAKNDTGKAATNISGGVIYNTGRLNTDSSSS